METNNKRLRVIVFDCENKKILYDEQTDCFIGGAIKDYKEFHGIFAGQGGRLQKHIAIREMMSVCRKLKRSIWREKGNQE